MKRHYRIGETVRVATGESDHILPRATIVERVGSGRTRRGAPQYRVRLTDNGTERWTSGSNIHADDAATAQWAETLRGISAVRAAKQRAIDEAVEKVSAQYQPLVDEANEANRQAARVAFADDLYRDSFDR